MAGLTYLFRQDGRFYFRRRVPKDLGSLIGKSEIKISLGSCCSLGDAKTRAIHLSAIYQDYFNHLRQSGHNFAKVTDHLNQRIGDLNTSCATLPIRDPTIQSPHRQPRWRTW